MNNSEREECDFNRENEENNEILEILINFYERKRAYIHALPIFSFIYFVFSIVSLTVLNYRYKPGDSELLRFLISTGVIAPVILIPIYSGLIYIFLFYSAFKKDSSRLKLAATVLVPTAAVLTTTADRIYAVTGRLDFEIFLIVVKHDAFLEIFAEGLTQSGFIFALIHLSIFSCMERKRNFNSIANVLIFWTLIVTPISLLLDLQ